MQKSDSDQFCILQQDQEGFRLEIPWHELLHWPKSQLQTVVNENIINVIYRCKSDNQFINNTQLDNSSLRNSYFF